MSLVLCYAMVVAANPLAEPQALSVLWRVIPNSSSDSAAPFVTEMVLRNNGDRELGKLGWRIHFNFCRKISTQEPHEGLRIVHINGDHYCLEPSPQFAPFRVGTERVIRFNTQYPLIKKTDGPSGFFLTLKNDVRDEHQIIPIGEPVFEPIDDKRQTLRTRDDLVSVPDATSRYEENLELVQVARKDPAIIPTPVFLSVHAGQAHLRNDATIVADEQLENEASYLADAFKPLLGARLPIRKADEASNKNVIVLSLHDLTIESQQYTAGDHAYELLIGDGEIAIRGTDPTGVFYGVQTLRALLPVESYRQPQEEIPIPAVEVRDVPQFQYRGMHLDVARNFQQPATIKKFLELMAFYKLNKFHFHLTDDEGWRFEVAGLPELTEIGARRLFTESGDGLPPSFGSGPSADEMSSHGSGYYSRADFVDILRYAAERHIEVIPEIDLPGHSRAAIRAMEARYKRLMAQNKPEEAREFLLHDVDDRSQYESVQLWNDNVVDVCKESTHAFVQHVLKDVHDMYAEAGIELTTIHFGGDEVPEGVWEGSICQKSTDGKTVSRKEMMAEFFQQIATSMTVPGVVAGAWEEIFLNDLKTSQAVNDPERNRFAGSDYLCYVWNNVWGWGQEDVAYRLANAGVNVVLCNATHLYFDLAYNKDPLEPGYYWAGFVETRTPYSFAPLNYLSKTRKDIYGHDISEENIKRRVRLTEEGKKHVIGLQGQLWAENLKGEASLEYMALPRLIALSERAWSKEPEWISDQNPETWPRKLQLAWSQFAGQLGMTELPRLDFLSGGFKYRVPKAGAIIENGILKANTEFPGLTIRYTVDGSEPDVNSPVYSEPTRVGTTANVRVFTSNGRGGQSCTVHERSLNLN